MNMDQIFQELLLTFGLSVAVCCMIMRLKPYGHQEEGGQAFNRTYDVKHDHQAQEHKLSYDFVSEIVEDEAPLLQDLRVDKEIVGGDESKCVSQEICNAIDYSHAVSEISEDVGVFQTLGRREEDVDGCTERLRSNEIEEILENRIEENLIRWDSHEIQNQINRGDEKTGKTNFGEVEPGLYEDDESSLAKFEEISQILGIEDDEHRGEKEKEGLFGDWEGVERTELEKLFGAAVVFVCSKSNAGLIHRDMKIELYGLHKIAIEGNCRRAQPMAFNIFARAKWDSWKKLGKMSRELAMEQYLLILSERVPGWMTSNLPVKQSRY